MTRRSEIIIRYIGVYLCEILVLAGLARLILAFIPSFRLFVLVSFGLLLCILTGAAIVVFVREWKREDAE